MMKKFLFCLSAILLMLSSCSKDEKSKLFATIPSDSSYVLLLDLQKINEGLGNKQESNGKLELGKQFSSFVRTVEPREGSDILKVMSSNDFTINYTYAAAFEDKGQSFVTFYVEDRQKFMDAISKRNDNTKFEKVSGVWMDENKTAGILNDQVWICVSHEEVTPGQILRFAKLDEKKSFNSVEYAQTMIDNNDDIQFYVETKSVADMMGSEGMAVKMAMATAFEDASFFTGAVNFSNGKATADLRILDKNFKPTKMAVALDELNMSNLDAFTGKGNLFFAFNIDPASVNKVISQYQETLQNQMMLDASIISALKNLDGTMAGSYDLGNQQNSFDIMVSFKNASDAQTLSDFIKNFGGGINVNTNNNVLQVSYGTTTGNSISSVASQLKGTYGGMIANFENMTDEQSKFISQYMKGYSLLAKKDGQGVKFNITANLKEGQNALITFMEFYKDMKALDEQPDVAEDITD